MNATEIIKFIVFIEWVVYLVVALMHLVLYLKGNDVSEYGKMYWILPTILLGLTLLTIFIIIPVADWWMS